MVIESFSNSEGTTMSMDFPELVCMMANMSLRHSSTASIATVCSLQDQVGLSTFSSCPMHVRASSRVCTGFVHDCTTGADPVSNTDD